MLDALFKLMPKLSFYIQAKITIPHLVIVMKSLDIHIIVSFINELGEPIKSR